MAARTSSYSFSNGNCVEVDDDWRTATYSQGASNCAEVGRWRASTVSASNGHCVEVAPGVLVRDTKQAHLPVRDTLRFTVPAWVRFIRQVKTVDWD
jgi:Domain of unknown function (DUF397)